jgi:hypothetical protein
LETHTIFYEGKEMTMERKLICSIGAIAAGIGFVVITHTATDFVLERNGILPSGNLDVNTSLIWAVIGYRTAWSLIGCYITAAIAPANPMKHALALGGIATVLSIVGSIAAAGLAPAWYGWALAALALPTAYLAGKLFDLRHKTEAEVKMSQFH